MNIKENSELCINWFADTDTICYDKRNIHNGEFDRMKALFIKELQIKWYEPVTIIIGFGLLIWFCIPFFFGVFNIGSYFGIFISLLLISYFPIKRFCKRKLTQKAFYITFSVVNFLATVFGIWVVFLTGLMIFAINQIPLHNVTVVTLGNQVNGDQPGPSLTARLNKTVEFLQEHPDVKCVVAGGLASETTLPEAEVMYRYLMQAGISPDRVATDTKSRNTQENLVNALQIINDKGWNKNVAIITEYYHQFRAGRLADDLGMRSYAVCADTPWYIFSCSYGRELISLTKFFCHL